MDNEFNDQNKNISISKVFGHHYFSELIHKSIKRNNQFYKICYGKKKTTGQTRMSQTTNVREKPREPSNQHANDQARTTLAAYNRDLYEEH